MNWSWSAVIAVIIGCSASAGAADRPIVVELFTSQGCSSCPPAEAVLVELARRPDVLALGFHVDYWDRLGWKDPFSSKAATQRQNGYAELLGSNQVYTPQMVIEGRRDVTGSDRRAVLEAIRAASPAQATVPLRLVRTGEELSILVGAGAGSGSAWLIGYDAQRETAVRRGENGGRTILQANIVRSILPLAEWRGREIALRRPAPVGDKAALILQAPDGRVLGATVLQEQRRQEQ